MNQHAALQICTRGACGLVAWTDAYQTSYHVSRTVVMADVHLLQIDCQNHSACLVLKTNYPACDLSSV